MTVHGFKKKKQLKIVTKTFLCVIVYYVCEYMCECGMCIHNH